VQSESQSNHSEQDTEVQYRVCREGIVRVFVQDLFIEIARGLYDTSIYGQGFTWPKVYSTMTQCEA
jgi:hypothetical protein